MRASKALSLLRLSWQHPSEFFDRVSTIMETRIDEALVKKPVYATTTWEQVISELKEHTRCSIDSFLCEQALLEIEAHVRESRDALERVGPFKTAHNADFVLARLCYIACRITRPSIVLETGVGYGVSSSFILQALSVNRSGALYSIDLPPLGRDSDRFVGSLIPQSLKNRWILCRGKSGHLLPKLLRDLAHVNVFVHDSLHTYRNMLWELETVTRYILPSGVVIADDVEGNLAFLRWSSRNKPSFCAVVEEPEKRNLLGLALFSHAHPSLDKTRKSVT